jgi:low temperature requirement protein LtrA
MLLAVMLASLVLSAGLTQAFESRGMLVAVAYIAIQTGRCLFMIVALRGEVLQIAFVRILAWTAASSVVVYVGAVEQGHVREALWAAAVAIDLTGTAFGFYVPGFSRSATREWTISGSHFAERCQAFVLIALGESIVVIGTRIAGIDQPTGAEIAAFLVAFAASAGLWWVYFDRAAEDSARVIATSADPGRLARNAFHWVHPLIIGAVIASAAADEIVLAHPSARGELSTAWLVLGGVALYLAGHALFKAVIWKRVSWPRVIGAALCLGLFALAPSVSALALSLVTLAVVVGVAIADRVGSR